MTPLQKRCQELLPVIQAGAEGKAIIWHAGKHWMPLGDGPGHVALNFLDDETYRIKPEPRYRPFTPEEALMQCGRRVIDKHAPERSEKIRTVGINRGTTEVWLSPDGGQISGQSWASPDYLLRTFVFDDGTPCGVLLTD